MFRTLIESKASHQRRAGAALLSSVSHIGILVGAAVFTAERGIAAPREPVVSTAVTWVKPPTPAAPGPRQEFPHQHVPFPCKICFGGIRVVFSPNAQAILPEPPAELGDAPPPRWCARASDCSLTSAAVDSGGVPGAGEIMISAAVLTQLRSGPPPRYPESLRSAGVDGRVVVQFVVDTLGAIEPASVKVILSSHDLFTKSVEAVLPRYRFVPSEVNGRRVRALAQMPFEFHLTR